MIGGRYDGNVVWSKDKIGKKIISQLLEKIPDYIEEWPRYDTGLVFKGTLRYPVKKQTQYKEQLITALASAFENSLQN